MVTVYGYRERLMDRLMPRLLEEVPGVLVVGPLAVGKTTTAQRYAATTVHLDNDVEAAAFRADPDSALAGLPEPVLLDEWQASPGVLGAVKRAIDAERSPGRFIVTGSVRSNLDADTWPGTGRLVWVDMHPLTVAEQLGVAKRPLLERLDGGEELQPAPDSPNLRDYVELALRGGFPEAAFSRSAMVRRRWLRSYIRQVAERDALDMDTGRDPARIGRYFEAYALNSAGLAQDKTIYTAAGVNRATAWAYTRLLADLRVIEELPAWSSNRLSRLVKAPKRYLADSALLGAVVGADASAVMRRRGSHGSSH